MFKLPSFITVRKDLDTNLIFGLNIGYITEFVRWSKDIKIYEVKSAIGINFGAYSIEIVLYSRLKSVAPVYIVNKELKSRGLYEL